MIAGLLGQTEGDTTGSGSVICPRDGLRATVGFRVILDGPTRIVSCSRWSDASVCLRACTRQLPAADPPATRT